MILAQARSLADAFPHEEEVPAALRPKDPIHQRSYLVGGELKNWLGLSEPVFSPVWIGQGGDPSPVVEIGSYPRLGGDEAEGALDAAVCAYDKGRGVWPSMRIADRAACLENFLSQMIGRRNEVVPLIMWEIAKSLADCEKEFDRTVDYIRATIEAVKELDNSSSRFLVVEGTIGQVRRTPLGVVLCMGPYNYPLNESFATLIPALIMGNTVVFKPPKVGILLFSPLLEAFRSAFPRGVVNIIYGKGEEIVPRLLGTGKVDVLTLIGSSKVADHLKKLHPKVNRLRAILGLDAKNAAVVMADADLDVAVKECLAGALSFNGQRCTALKMLLVHRSIADDFTARFCKALAELKVGMPWEAGVNITPLPEVRKVDQMVALVDDAVSKGARIINPGGGESWGTLFYPAVVYPVQEGMRLYREEQFGPIVPIAPFDEISAALEYVVNSEHGQQVSIFSSDPDEIGRTVDALVHQVCRVNINCQCQRGPDVFPFTGRKDSAEGTLSVTDALRSFSIRSMVATKETRDNERLLGDIVQGQRSSFISTHYTF